MQTFYLLRILGVVVGLVIVSHGFARFRTFRIGRTELLLRWSIGLALLVVAIWPDSVNFLVGLLAMRDYMFGRLIALLTLSNLLLWLLLFHERGRRTEFERNFDLLIRRWLVTGAPVQPSGEALRDAAVLVALPALNESANIGPVLERMPKAIAGHDVATLVVDDGSRDDTADTARKMGSVVVSNPYPRGQGAALRIGYELALETSCAVVVTMDADGQHAPEEIAALVEPILDDTADLVIGSRILGRRERDSVLRLAGVHLFSTLINLMAGTRVTDCSSGFKAFRVDSLNTVDLRENQFQAAEAIIASARAGLRIREVPITVTRRAAGTTKKGKNVSYAANFAKTVFKSWWR